ncbi:hypothetical protein FA95DRAFT_1588021 [Auriscalpium vulgare]|uniref:Uncharacterized protein n=1 Tax=Auriscalpium vulgare TaxID=40419 RepID=A0ACB8S1B9_9AGAM|nr:hypothetical protein FA95DRAFT_1588021 [Auriscalpium vulgare]
MAYRRGYGSKSFGSSSSKTKVSNPHHLEYSKSSRAKCHGSTCGGTNISLGDLRYGHSYIGDYGEMVKWMHWGCVTTKELGTMAGYGVERVTGFHNLRAEDQKKVRMALAMRRIDPADVYGAAEAAVPMPSSSQTASQPPSSQPPMSSQPPASSQPSLSQPASSQPGSSTPSGPGPSQKKRKAMYEAQFGASQPSMTQPTATGSSSYHGVRRPNAPAGTTWEEGAEDDQPDAEPIDELYCTMVSKVVGIQYYNGLVDAGEQVRLIREPQNKFDKNAIQVINIGNTQVGHLPRDIALKLAPLMDQKKVTLEGTMRDGNLRGSSYVLSVTLKIFGAADKRAQLEPLLIWATPGQRGFPKMTTAPPTTRTAVAGDSYATSSEMASGSSLPPGYTSGYPAASYPGSQAPAYSASPYSSQAPATRTPAQIEAARKQQESLAKAAELRQLLNSLEKVDDEGRRGSLLDTLCSTEDVLKLPVHESPPGIESGELKVDLLRHQKQALLWCIEHETPKVPRKEGEKPVQFWQYRKTADKSYYYNVATKTPQQAAPALGKGALCGDSMGLGKTLTMISLILATKQDNTPGFSKSTLIVVPLSIMSNWEKQLQDHCVPGALTSTTYYGNTRALSAADLQRYDIVITTYQTVAGEHANALGATGVGAGGSKKRKKGESNLFGVKWKRVILDEGHNIRNPRTKMAQAVCALEADRRWVLTGTPIINSPQDLGSILTFLKICRPLDDANFFKALVLRPLKDGDPTGAEILRALMSQICIRRTKEMQDSEGNYLVPLPPVEMTLVPVALHPEARALYDTVEQLSQQRIEGFMDSHGGMNAVAVSTNALSMLTRLRQLALHPGLVPADYAEQLRRANELDAEPDAAIHVSAEDRVRLQGALAQAIEDNEECPICFGVLDEPRITACAHRFCLACITEVITRDPKCPMDRRTIGMGDLIEPPPPTELTQKPVRLDDEDDEDDEDALNGLRTGSSAKIDQLVHLLKLTPPTEKSLVFSQFTSFLDKIAETLDSEGISYVRFDGQMSARRRQETLEAFCVPIEEGDADAAPIASHPAAASAASTPTPAPFPMSTEGGRSVRRRSNARGAAADPDSSFQDGDATDGDDDFRPTTIELTDDDDDDFIDDEDEDGAWAKKGKGKAKAGKGKGKPKPKAKAKARFSGTTSIATYRASAASGVNPKVMLISLKAGALGLNLTVANNVYLMDPWWQEGIESQAIDRCNRIGQTKPVHVYQLIAENTVESKVIDIQEKKKLLIKQAFSGMKSRETQRQKKEARLQDLVQLFGIRRQAATQHF